MFKWRSYLPLLLIIVIFLSLADRQFGLTQTVPGIYWEMVCLAISVFGLGIRIYTVGHAPEGTSGRNTDDQVASVLNSRGIYSIVRHPLYVGNYFMWLGVALFPGIWWLAIMISLVFFIYYERIMFAEEEFLRGKFGKTFEDWAVQTPAFIPDLRKWKKPERGFLVKKVLRDEYSSMFAMVTSFLVVEVGQHFIVSRTFHIDLPWLIILIAGFVLYIGLRTIKKTTHWLDI